MKRFAIPLIILVVGATVFGYRHRTLSELRTGSQLTAEGPSMPPTRTSLLATQPMSLESNSEVSQPTRKAPPSGEDMIRSIFVTNDDAWQEIRRRGMTGILTQRVRQALGLSDEEVAATESIVAGYRDSIDLLASKNALSPQERDRERVLVEESFGKKLAEVVGDERASEWANHEEARLRRESELRATKTLHRVAELVDLEAEEKDRLYEALVERSPSEAEQTSASDVVQFNVSLQSGPTIEDPVAIARAVLDEAQIASYFSMAEPENVLTKETIDLFTGTLFRGLAGETPSE